MAEALRAATEALAGGGAGFQFTQTRGTEQEIRQGGNHAFAGFVQGAQAGSVCILADRIANFIPNPVAQTVIKVFANIMPFLSFPIAIGFGAVRDRTPYPGFAAFINDYIGIPLPAHVDDMSPWVVATIDFLAEHSGDIMQVAMFVGSVALIALGNAVFGACILGALVYQILDEDFGIVPRRISLFVEQYMPIISWVGILIAGNPVLQVMAAIALIMYIPGVFPFLMEQLDSFVVSKARGCDLPIAGASLHEINAPLQERKEMTYNQICAILGDRVRLEIDPAHCGKWVVDKSTFPRDLDFGKLIALFDSIDWASKYAMLQRKLKDDDRFLDMLQQEFPAMSRETLIENFDTYVNRLANRAEKESNAWAAEWVRDQLVNGLLPVLRGEGRIKGRQQDLDTAINDISILIPFLEGCRDADDGVTVEDDLLALAVEGGRYCGRGIKRVAGELVRQVVHATQVADAKDPDRDYELKIRQELQNQRAQIVDTKFNELMELLRMPDAVRKDVHGHDIYRLFLARGFYPLTPYELDEMGTIHYLVWETYHHNYAFHGSMFRAYRADMEAAFANVGEVNFALYIQRMINANPNLIDAQKEALIERLTSLDVDMAAFHRLMLVMIGVLRPTDRAEEGAAVAARA